MVSARRIAIRALFAAGALAYGVAAISVRAFTDAAYVVLAVPIAALTVLALVPRPGAPGTRGLARWRGLLPGIALVVAAIGIEIGALALGGRDAHLPTLSTMLDDLTPDRALRYLGFEVWFALGCTRACARGGTS